MSYERHRAEAPRQLRCAVLTVSDTRSEETDESGKLIMELLKKEGHTISGYRVVKDEYALIRNAVVELAKDAQLVVTNGGTGMSKRDVTIEAVSPLLSKKLEGFGEVFRMLSYQEVGAPAMMSRALAGVYGSRIIICIPGSPKAAELALQKLIIPEMAHMFYEANR